MYLNSKQGYEAKMVIREKTGYQFRSNAILSQVFRRSSYAAENGITSNEVFEYLGDQVLNYYLSKYLAERCGAMSLTADYRFRIHEGQFTQIKQALVNNESLAQITDSWDIAKYLFLGRSDIRNRVIEETKVRADLFEAVLGGIAIDCDWDQAVLEKAVVKALDLEVRVDRMIESDWKVRSVDIDSAVTVLKEEAERGNCTMPVYDFSGPDALGYDNDGNPIWACNCTIVNERIGIVRSAKANSKKDVKKAAAYLVLCDHWDMQNKYGTDKRNCQWIYKDGKLYPDK